MSINKPHAFAVIDVETTGPKLLRNSMISVGVVVVTLEKDVLYAARANIQELKGSERDPETMKFWNAHPEAWQTITRNPLPVLIAMSNLLEPMERIASEYNMEGAAYPSSFDSAWWRLSLEQANLEDPLKNAHSWYCIKSSAQTLGTTGKTDALNKYADGLEITHDPLEDCFAEAAICTNVARRATGLHPVDTFSFRGGLRRRDIVRQGHYLAPRFAGK